MTDQTMKVPLLNGSNTENLFDSSSTKDSLVTKTKKKLSFGNEDVDSEIYNLPNIDEVNSKVMCKLLTVSVVCVIFMVAEVVGGYIANSLAIMTDAAHLFADLSGFFISIFSLWLAKRPSSHVMSFGYHRAEVIGALASVILIWILTAFLVYEAIDRIRTMAFEMEGWFMLGTAIFGLFCNLTMGKILHSHGGHSHGEDGHDHGHGHSHGHHGHSHGGHSHPKKEKKVKPALDKIKEHPESFDKEHIGKEVHAHKHSDGDNHDHNHDHDHEEHDHEHHHEGDDHNHDHDHKHKEGEHKHKDHEHEHKKDHDHPHKKHDHSHNHEGDHDHDHEDHDHNHQSFFFHKVDLENPKPKSNKAMLSAVEEKDNVNLRAAMIHILGVVIAAIIVVCRPDWKIVDPICTLVFAIIVIFTTVGVSRDCILVLMEATPIGLDMSTFNKEIGKVSGVKEIHDLHIWSLAPGKPALSAHIFSTDVEKTLRKATVLCRMYGIYHSTIQVEDWNKRNDPGFIKCDHNIHN